MNFNKKRTRWFCNRPLSPVVENTPEVSSRSKLIASLCIVQDKTNSGFQQENTEKDWNLTKEATVVTNNLRNPKCSLSDEEIVVDTRLADSNYTLSGKQVCIDDDLADPNHSPFESDISDTSPIIFCSPPSSPEATVVNNKQGDPKCSLSDGEMVFDTDLADSSYTLSGEKTFIGDDLADPNYSPCKSEISDISSIIFSSSLSSPENLHTELNTEVQQKEESAKIHQSFPVDCQSMTENKKQSNKSVFCCYCECYVLNFPRHLTRNHTTELAVQKILALSPRNKNRKKLLFSLRKKGNYLNSTITNKPVRKGDQFSNYAACTYCLGYYSTKNMWRHRKNCEENVSKAAPSKNALSDCQNFFLRHLRVDPQLKLEVFPRMRGDYISLEAKKDALICAYAARYLKIHREKHFISVTSRKMRELARLLIEIRKIKPCVKSLIDSLKPEYYDVLVDATKVVAKYDSEKQNYESPTYALNMGTTLKQCCDIALLHTLKKSDLLQTVNLASIEINLKTLMKIIEANWKFDVSSQASSDLSLKKWNKITLVPLASDLKLLKNYLIEKSKIAVLKLLESNDDEDAYLTLLNTVYCRLMLLNRRRPGELQRLLVQTYISALQNENPQGYEEFSEAISDTEKFLMNNFKRIVIRGKRGRGVPVLFNKELQEHLDLILKCRNSILKKPNIYLFATPNSDEPIRGYKVLNRFANECGAHNPNALTSTKLRKHLATLTQLFCMTENDMEQLASFMGHTLGVHRK
ncbi:unnamed protein product [Diabrotica balteata]|uniref:Uncharacterized protein n=1 Tax=Diabrotica balteata TaxID=107213 RepID=A0A9N9X977_DIABA|nr:unnamed protein product [Diabrotica balteata]